MQMLLPRYDALDPAVLDDPYPVYAQLRRVGPLCRGGVGQWVVTRHADVSRLLRDPQLGHQFPDEYRRFALGEGPACSFFGRIILDRDPPSHVRLRRLMASAFSPTLVGRIGARIPGWLEELLQPVQDLGRFDVVHDLAYPLPVRVVCELMGIPAVDQDAVRPRAVDLARAFGTRVPDEDRRTVDEAVLWLRAYLGALITERRGAPEEDLLSRMIATQSNEDGLSDEEIVDNAVFLFFAGFETTMNLIANGCAALLGHPDQLDRLRAEPAMIPTAVEELLRFDAPVQSAGRMVREPMEIDGRRIAGGRVLLLLIGSANHDERAFVAPERLDVGRTPNPHLSFGGGAHYCLGAALARLEACAAFTELLRRFATIETAGEAVRRPSAGFRSFASLPVAVRNH
jgi:cytochrome P450